MAVAGLVLGILSVLGAYVPLIDILTLVLGIVGIVLSVKGRKEAMAENKPHGLATAGLVLSIVGTSLSGIFAICYACYCAAGLAATGSIIDNIESLNDLFEIFDSL